MHTRRMREMFDGVAARYDLLNSLCSLGLHRRWRRAALRLCPQDAARALDICTGTGDWAIALSSRCPFVVGLDVSPEMLRLARRKAGEAAHLLLGDALRLPFPDSSFDLATMGFSLRNVSPLFALFAEVRRVLRPGGVFVSLELTRPSSPVLARLHRTYLWRIVPALGLLSRRAAYRYLAESIMEFPSREQVAGELRRTGFADVHFVPLSGGIVTVHVASVDGSSAGRRIA